MTRQWLTMDWLRVAGATAAFVAPLKALTLPWPKEVAPKDPLAVRVLLTLALAGVAAFVIWFVASL